MNNRNLLKGILLILLSAVFTATGQLCWKLGTHHLLLLLAGFALYGLGALLMIAAFKYGELSVLQPMLSISYILSFVLGYFWLSEPITVKKLLGMLCIIAGMISLGLSSFRGTKGGKQE